MRLKILLGIVTLFCILSISRTESPLPPPYYQYNISGYLQSDVSKDIANYTLQLFGLPKSNYNINKWVQCRGMNRSDEQPFFITDSTGYFSLKVNNQYLFDSIKVGIIQPGNIKYGETIYVDENLLIKVEVDYNDQNKTGCSSCTNEPAYKVIEKYIYNNHNYNIKIGA